MGLVKKLFAQNDLAIPRQLTFEAMAKEFMNIVKDRYPSADKIIKSTKPLGIEDDIQAKIIVLSQFRDAVYQVDVNRIFGTVQRRDQVYSVIIEALEQLEDELEEFQAKQIEAEWDEEEGVE